MKFGDEAQCFTHFNQIKLTSYHLMTPRKCENRIENFNDKNERVEGS